VSGASVERLLLRPSEAAIALGVSRSKCYELIASGAIPSLRVGSSVRIPWLRCSNGLPSTPLEARGPAMRGEVDRGLRRQWTDRRRREDLTALPDPTRSDSEHLRFRCEDIAGMTRAAAWAEAQRLRNALVGVVERGARLFWVTGDVAITDAEWIYRRLQLLAAKLQASQPRVLDVPERSIEKGRR
jgi:excisionase family DNA binding protein